MPHSPDPEPAENGLRRPVHQFRLQAELLELAHDAVIVRDPASSRVGHRTSRRGGGSRRSTVAGAPDTGRMRIVVAEDDHDDRLLISDAVHVSGLDAELLFMDDGDQLLGHLESPEPPRISPVPASFTRLVEAVRQFPVLAGLL
jgi:hypothetical protein